VQYEHETGQIIRWVRMEFEFINKDWNLTEADKKQLKDFYLQNMIAPKARKLLEKHFPEEFGRRTTSKEAPKTHTHQDR
jgi:hypothetical protein